MNLRVAITSIEAETKSFLVQFFILFLDCDGDVIELSSRFVKG